MTKLLILTFAACLFLSGCAIADSFSTTDQSACAIKGNINQQGEKIYHRPDCTKYNDTNIDIRDGERWFCSEEQAQQAGWAKSPSCI